MINRVRQAVISGGLFVFFPVVVAYAFASFLFPVRVVSQFAAASTLISTLLLLWLYRGTARAVLHERADTGYMWFAVGFTTLVCATVLNVSYVTWNYVNHVVVVSSSSYWLAGVRLMYVIAFWAFIVAKMAKDVRVPLRGWGTIVGIIFAAIIATGLIVWWRGEM